MTKIIGIILLLAGVWLAYTGYQRKESLAGKVESGAAAVAEKVDGEPRVANHTWYLIGGGVLAIIGLGAIIKKSA